MEAIMISLVVVLAICVVGGPLGWGIVITAVLYFIFETVSTNIQKSQKKMRREMDMILSKNSETQRQIEEALLEDKDDNEGEVEIDEIDEVSIEPKEQPIRRGETDISERSEEEVQEETPDNKTQENDGNSIVDRVDAAAGVLDALEERDRNL